MDEVLNYRFLDNTIGSYLLVFAIILMAVLVKRLLSRYIAGLLFAIVKRIAKGVDKKNFVDLVMSPLEIFLVILVTLIAFDKLTYPALLDFKIYKVTLRSILEGLSLIILIVTFIWLLLRIIDFVAMILEQKANLTADLADNQLIVFFKDFFKVLLVILGILLVLKFAFGYEISSLITGLSLAGAAIALATRESIENLIASFIIFFDRPFTTGDLVKVHAITGTVEKIGLRSTRIRTDQKSYVTVPNKQMVDSILDNLSLRTQRRNYIQIDLHGQSSPQTVQQFITLIEGKLSERRDKIENFTVMLSDIQRALVVVTVEYFTAPIPMTEFNEVKQDVNFRIIQLMEQLGLKTHQ